jgi:uncharacterized protein YjcR
VTLASNEKEVQAVMRERDAIMAAKEKEVQAVMRERDTIAKEKDERLKEKDDRIINLHNEAGDKWTALPEVSRRPILGWENLGE